MSYEIICRQGGVEWLTPPDEYRMTCEVRGRVGFPAVEFADIARDRTRGRWPLSPEVGRRLDRRAWEIAADTGPPDYNGSVARLAGVSVEGPVVRLTVQRSSYLTALLLQIERREGAAVLMPELLNVYTALTTADGQLMLGRRGATRTAPYRHHSASGGIVEFVGEDIDPFHTALEEMEQEVTRGLIDREDLRFRGIVRYTTAYERTPACIFTSRSRLTCSEILARRATYPPRDAHEAESLEFLPCADSDSALATVGRLAEMWREDALTGAGLLTSLLLLRDRFTDEWLDTAWFEATTP